MLIGNSSTGPQFCSHGEILRLGGTPDTSPTKDGGDGDSDIHKEYDLRFSDLMYLW
jgi:hypothetical protein